MSDENRKLKSRVDMQELQIKHLKKGIDMVCGMLPQFQDIIDRSVRALSGLIQDTLQQEAYDVQSLYLTTDRLWHNQRLHLVELEIKYFKLWELLNEVNRPTIPHMVSVS